MRTHPPSRINVHITGGIWRGRQLPKASARVRPTTARGRQTLFQWLGNRVVGRRCLDLFAGSGSLSLEALSRGAVHATMLEIDARCHSRIRKHLDLLSCHSRVRLMQMDSRQWLRRVARPSRPWNLIFVDPPYSSRTALERLHLLCDRQLVADDSLLYMETGSGDDEAADKAAPSPWQLDRQSRQSRSLLRLYSLPAIPATAD